MIKTVVVCNRCKEEKELDFDQVVMNREEAIGEAGFNEMPQGKNTHMCDGCLELLDNLKKEQNEQLEKFIRGM